MQQAALTLLVLEELKDSQPAPLHEIDGAHLCLARISRTYKKQCPRAHHNAYHSIGNCKNRVGIDMNTQTVLAFPNTEVPEHRKVITPPTAVPI